MSDYREFVEYYDGTKILSMGDIDREKPSIYIIAGNRTAGKTVFFKRMLINNFKKKGRQFVLLYRNMYELNDVAEGWFEDIRDLFFQDDILEQKPVAKGLFQKLLLNGELCGYAVSLSNYDKVKQKSSHFVHIEDVFFDEFQSESGKYLTKELTAFQSLIVSFARGKGEQHRYIRIILVSNTVTLMNPYYIQFGIHKRLRVDTKFMRGSGWVMECAWNESASKAMEKSAFAKAFAGSKYLDYAKQNIYLNDNQAFVEKISGFNRYKLTIKMHGLYYGVREFTDQGIIYISNHGDKTHPVQITFNPNDHDANTLLAMKNVYILNYLRTCFDNGLMRFQNLESKNMIFDVLSLQVV